MKQSLLRIKWRSDFFFKFIFGCAGSLLLSMGFLLLQGAGATLCCGAQASHCGGFCCCRAQVLGAWAPIAVDKAFTRVSLVAQQ